jgi:hypothetical protein
MDTGDATTTDDAQLLSYKDWTILLAEESLVDFGNDLILIGGYMSWTCYVGQSDNSLI